MAHMIELLSRSIKLYAWEYAFIRRVLHVRNDLELKLLKKIGIVTVSINLSNWISGRPHTLIRHSM
jgi:hypothetical protein